MASGRPVIAFGRGGATETVVEGRTGTFFKNQTVDDLIDAIERLDTLHLDSETIVLHAQEFGAERFASAMRNFVDTHLAAHG